MRWETTLSVLFCKAEQDKIINLPLLIKVSGLMFNILKRSVKTNNVSFICLFVLRVCMAFMCPDIGALLTYYSNKLGRCEVIIRNWIYLLSGSLACYFVIVS